MYVYIYMCVRVFVCVYILLDITQLAKKYFLNILKTFFAMLNKRLKNVKINGLSPLLFIKKTFF